MQKPENTRTVSSKPMVKLIIQIPCWNEEKLLPITLGNIPNEIPGVDVIETLVIDDGSIDKTSEVAKSQGVSHIIEFKKHKGLAKAFMAGIEYCLRHGAHIIVNFDADNSFRGDDIPKLIQPILAGEAEIVIGSRNIDAIEHYSWTKKKLQRIGSWVVRKVSETEVKDAPCGFRAFSREAAFQMNVISKYSYTLETIIQAGQKDLAIKSVDIDLNQKLRDSRLIRGTWHYIGNSIMTIIRIFTLYQPLKVFSWIGGLTFSFGALLGARYLFLQIIGTEKDLFASLILTAILLIMGVNFFVLGLMADLIGSNTYSVETILAKLKRLEMDPVKKKQSNLDSRINESKK